MRSLSENLEKVCLILRKVAYYYIKEFFSAGHIATGLETMELPDVLNSINYWPESKMRFNQLDEVFKECASKGANLPSVKTNLK